MVEFSKRFGNDGVTPIWEAYFMLFPEVNNPSAILTSSMYAQKDVPTGQETPVPKEDLRINYFYQGKQILSLKTVEFTLSDGQELVSWNLLDDPDHVVMTLTNNKALPHVDEYSNQPPPPLNHAWESPTVLVKMNELPFNPATWTLTVTDDNDAAYLYDAGIIDDSVT